MNAILRYVGEFESMGKDSVANKHSKETASKSSLTLDPELSHVPYHLEQKQTTPVEDGTAKK